MKHQPSILPVILVFSPYSRMRYWPVLAYLLNDSRLTNLSHFTSSCSGVSIREGIKLRVSMSPVNVPPRRSIISGVSIRMIIIGERERDLQL